MLMNIVVYALYEVTAERKRLVAVFETNALANVYARKHNIAGWHIENAVAFMER